MLHPQRPTREVRRGSLRALRAVICAAWGALTACENRTDAGNPDPSPGAPSESGSASSAQPTASTPAPFTPRVLVFSKTVEYRHASIDVAVPALQAVAQAAHWQLEATEDAKRFSAEGLGSVDVVVFLNTTGDVLDSTQQAAMEAFIRAGNGYVGVHAASDTEYDWPWYGALVGAYFEAHPAIQPADVLVVDASHRATQHLPAVWQRTDEWYGFRAQPAAGIDVLLRLDELSYDPGQTVMGEHPIAWAHEYDGGRAFYTALGHTNESYTEPAFLTHLQEAIAWAAGL